MTENLPSIQNKTWKDFLIKDLFDINATKSGIEKSKLKLGVEKIPYITRTDKRILLFVNKALHLIIKIF